MQNCLIIDEENQSVFLEEINLEAKKNGLDVSFLYFNPKNNDWLDFSINPPTVNIELLRADLTESFLNRRIDIILCDYDFKIKNIDGFELLRWVRTKKKSPDLILYSGKGDFQNTFIQETFKRNPDEIRQIISSKINDIIFRDDRKGVLLNYLMEVRFDTDLFIEEELSNHSDLKIKNSYPPFEGLTVGEILQFISDGSKKGFLFKRNILELAIAHLVELEK